MSVNKAILVGHLGADPETRYTADGRAVTTMRLATSERFTDREGNPQERTEWHRIVVWGKQAEHCSTYLSKGKQAYVEGRLQTREWTDRDGGKRFTTEIVADRVVFLSSPRSDRGRSEGAGSSAGNQGGKPDDDGYFSAPSKGSASSGRGDFGSPAGEEDVPF